MAIPKRVTRWQALVQSGLVRNKQGRFHANQLGVNHDQPAWRDSACEAGADAADS